MIRKPQARNDIVEAAAHLNRLGYLVADSGFITARAEQKILFTPPGVHRSRLDPKQLGGVRLDGKGRQEIAVDSEMWTHLVIYREREDIGAVVFAQPPRATGFAVAGMGLDERILPELVLRLGGVPLVRRDNPVGQASVEATSVIKNLDQSRAFLIANRGVLTVGADVWEAVSRQELVEHYARVLLTARLLGNVESLPDSHVARLVEAHFQDEGGRNL